MIPDAHPLFLITPGASEPDIAIKTSIQLTSWDPQDLMQQVSLGDLRARTALVVNVYNAASVGLWAWLCGYANRYLDIIVGDTVVDALKVRGAGVRVGEKLLRPDQRAEEVVLGEGTPWPVSYQQPFNPETNLTVRWAHNVTYVPADKVLEDFVSTIALCGLRFRAGSERFISTMVDNHILELDKLRSEGVARRQENLRGTYPVLPAQDNPRAGLYVSAAFSVDIEELLLSMGTHRHGEFWHCPRPERHTNGDKNPSTRVEGGRVRCGRCDGDWIDPISLVIDVYSVSADDAVAILEGRKPTPEHNARTLGGWVCSDEPENALSGLFSTSL